MTKFEKKNSQLDTLYSQNAHTFLVYSINTESLSETIVVEYRDPEHNVTKKQFEKGGQSIVSTNQAHDNHQETER